MSALRPPLLTADVVPDTDVLPDAEAASDLVDRFVDYLPRLGTALGLIIVAILAAKVIRSVLRPRLAKARTPSFGDVASRLIAYSIVLVAMLIAATIVFPSVQPVDMIASLGVLSIAAGFAFQDILSNLLSGILLIIRQPFVAGDQIEVNGHHGTVDGITIRETRITTFAGHQIIIPNKDVYQSAIDVQTNHDAVRTSLIVGCSYDDDLRTAVDAATRALESVDGVLSDPAPETYFTGFGGSSIDLDLRYWTAPRQAEIRRVQHEVVLAVKSAFDEAGLDIPFPIRTLESGESLRGTLETIGRHSAGNSTGNSN